MEHEEKAMLGVFFSKVQPASTLAMVGVSSPGRDRPPLGIPPFIRGGRETESSHLEL